MLERGVHMAKSDNQKLKLLYIKQMLEEKTDEKHVLSTQDIIAGLAANGIKAERKSIYSDIEALTNYGMDIILRKERPTGYYLASRDFELPELKLLVDAVQTSKFITEKKSRGLIKKLESLASKYDGNMLQRQVIVTDRIKSMNESIYYNVDAIHQAISNNVKVKFKYVEWTAAKQTKYKRDGEEYLVSPWALTWSEDNYYMIGFDSKNGKVKHYRVDKMHKPSLSNEPRDGKESFENFDMAKFSKQTFGMFAGTEKKITLECSQDIIGVIIDRFGQDAGIRMADKDVCRVNVTVNVSPMFYGWLCGLGSKVRIVEPAQIADDYRKYLKGIAKMYKKD